METTPQSTKPTGKKADRSRSRSPQELAKPQPEKRSELKDVARKLALDDEEPEKPQATAASKNKAADEEEDPLNTTRCRQAEKRHKDDNSHEASSGPVLPIADEATDSAGASAAAAADSPGAAGSEQQLNDTLPYDKPQLDDTLPHDDDADGTDGNCQQV